MIILNAICLVEQRSNGLVALMRGILKDRVRNVKISNTGKNVKEKNEPNSLYYSYKKRWIAIAIHADRMTRIIRS